MTTVNMTTVIMIAVIMIAVMIITDRQIDWNLPCYLRYDKNHLKIPIRL